jgi:L-cystine transport system permease protein
VPQAARVSAPPLSNTFISLVKDTSLASLILVTELFRKSQEIAAFSQEFMVLYVEAAVVYWVLCLFLSFGQSTLEGRLDRYVAH